MAERNCRDMKAHLVELDSEGSGRVPLGLLYAQPASASYHFSESTDYLRKIGALDETTSTPKVFIASYIAGPSNCIASSSYYSVCCLVACDGLMRDLEGSIRAPQVLPEPLLLLVGNLSSPSIDAPRQISPGLVSKLHTIADRHEGMVPLHSRLFAQWMHLVFPQECPFPHLSVDPMVMTPSRWHGGGIAAKDLRVKPEDKQRLIDESARS